MPKVDRNSSALIRGLPFCEKYEVILMRNEDNFMYGLRKGGKQCSQKQERV